MPERLLALLDVKDEADVKSILEAKEDAWVEKIIEIFGDEGHQRVWLDYISKLSLSHEEFDARTKVYTARVANAETAEDRIRLTFSAIRWWTDPNPILHFAEMDARIERWALRGKRPGPDPTLPNSTDTAPD